MARTYEALTKHKSETPDYGSKRKRLKSDENPAFRSLQLPGNRRKGEIEKKISYFKKKVGAQVFNFTSSRGDEGVTTITLDTARYVAAKNKDKKILLIDGNLLNPALAAALNLANKPGLADVLFHGRSPLELIREEAITGLDLLPAGIWDALEEYETSQLDSVIAILKEQYDIILIDSSPLLTSDDALSNSLVSDLTFLIICSGLVQKEVVKRALFLLQDNECPTGGIILNRVSQVIPSWLYRLI